MGHRSTFDYSQTCRKNLGRVASDAIALIQFRINAPETSMAVGLLFSFRSFSLSGTLVWLARLITRADERTSKPACARFSNVHHIARNLVSSFRMDDTHSLVFLLGPELTAGKGDILLGEVHFDFHIPAFLYDTDGACRYSIGGN